jgi:hypothetical protein
MSRPRTDRRDEFSVEDGWLVRTAFPTGRPPYQHRCSLDSYRAVIDFIDAHAAGGVTTNGLWEGLPDVPASQASVALAFLKERGCVEVRRRRCYPASGVLLEDALIEFHALAAGLEP